MIRKNEELNEIIGFSECDITIPWEVRKIRQYENIGVLEIDNCQLIVGDGKFIFIDSESRHVIDYPMFVLQQDYDKVQIDSMLEQYRTCIFHAESRGFEI